MKQLDCNEKYNDVLETFKKFFYSTPIGGCVLVETNFGYGGIQIKALQRNSRHMFQIYEEIPLHVEQWVWDIEARLQKNAKVNLKSLTKEEYIIYRM